MCVSTPYIVYLLNAKSIEGKADYVRASEWGVEWCTLNSSGVWRG